MTLRFTDGVNIDTNRQLRLLKLDDGWYVVGEGMLIACASREEAVKMLAELVKD